MSRLTALTLRPTAMFLVLCFLWLPSSALASAPATDNTLTVAQMQLIVRAAKFTEYTRQGILFDAEGATEADLPSDFVASMARTYQRMNEKAARDHLDWGKVVESINARKNSPPLVVPPVPDGDVQSDWNLSSGGYYWQLTLNEYETQIIINSLWTGGGLGAVYAAITGLGIVTLPATAAVALAAALMCFGAGYLGLVDTLGHNKGIYFRVYTLTSSVFVWHN